jgi:hypothetical protein
MGKTSTTDRSVPTPFSTSLPPYLSVVTMGDSSASARDDAAARGLPAATEPFETVEREEEEDEGEHGRPTSSSATTDVGSETLAQSTGNVEDGSEEDGDRAAAAARRTAASVEPAASPSSPAPGAYAMLEGPVASAAYRHATIKLKQEREFTQTLFRYGTVLHYFTGRFVLVPSRSCFVKENSEGHHLCP